MKKKILFIVFVVTVFILGFVTSQLYKAYSVSNVISFEDSYDGIIAYVGQKVRVDLKTISFQRQKDGCWRTESSLLDEGALYVDDKPAPYQRYYKNCYANPGIPGGLMAEINLIQVYYDHWKPVGAAARFDNGKTREENIVAARAWARAVWKELFLP